MNNRYATMAMTGLNDPSKTLKCADESAHYWDAFADAKAALVARAEVLHEYLDAYKCNYHVRSESSDHQYEVAIEYGPLSSDLALPFRTVFRVFTCNAQGWHQKVQR